MSTDNTSGNPSDALFTDLYELTMAQAYRHAGQTGQATFSLFVRTLPPDRGFLLFAGLEDALSYLERLHFSESDIASLRESGRFEPDFVDFLAGLRFTGSVRAMSEGTPFFANEPVLEVTAPVIEAQLVETYLLNRVNAQSLFATKAARVVHAAAGRPVADFAARRTHGADAADRFARASYIGGFSATSNVGAGTRYGIPATGTMAHSFIASFRDEADAFRAYSESFPDSTTLLVDTYDTLNGVTAAIAVGRELATRGHRLRAIRLDSGDLAALARRARVMLDDAGLDYVKIVVSGGLDEYAIGELLRAGAPIDSFGVGTLAGTSADAPWLDAVYKMVSYEGRPVRKTSPGKQTLPGPKQVWRVPDDDGMAARDHIIAASAGPPEPDAVPLLQEVMREGKRADDSPGLDAVRRRAKAEIGRLPAPCRELRSPERYPVVVAPGLVDASG